MVRGAPRHLLPGDGDGLAIGAGHFPHAARRNPDLTYLMFDNQVYGLTKGQFSPTTPLGDVTTTTKHGSIEEPMNPCTLAMAYGASFVARGFSGNEQFKTIREKARWLGEEHDRTDWAQAWTVASQTDIYDMSFGVM